MTKIYVAISKATGNVMSGAKEQYAFGSTATLRRSIGQAYAYTARTQNMKPHEMYEIHEIDLDKVLHAPPKNSEPFVVKEIHGTNWNDEARIEFYVNDSHQFSCGSLSECPEDATLGRDLDFVYDIKDLMKDAWEAGKAGRPFIFLSEDEDEEEEE